MLNASHRCDRCGAAAAVQMRRTGASDALLFCGHHFARHRAALICAGWRGADVASWALEAIPASEEPEEEPEEEPA